MDCRGVTMAECRICLEEDRKRNLEIPCACSGSSKYAHRKCIERWSHQKGDSICELCNQEYVMGRVGQMPRGDPDIQMEQDKMAFVWQERVHDNEDIAAYADAGCRNAMQACGLLKFFLTPRLRAQPDLLEFLIRAWNPVDGKFTIRGRDIEFDSTDIYFLTGLSRRGEMPILEGQRPSGETLDMLMARVCPQARKTRSGKVSIPTVEDIVLRSILFLVTRAAGCLANHEASKTHLLLALECLQPTIFNWAAAVTISMKRQLSNCRRGESKQFGYGSILVPLMLERVPALQLQDMVVDPPRGPRETRASRWGHVMPRGGGGRPVAWGVYFREWLDRQVIFVEDWPYAGIDFRGDPDMPLPAGEHWDNGDVGPTRPLGLAPEARREGQGAGVLALASPRVNTTETVIQNLEGLLAGVPDYQGIEEVPIAFQIHTVGVEPRMHRLLRRVARAGVCYREHNPPQ